MNTQNVPVIDIGRLSHPATLEELDAACRDWGFFQVVNHGIGDAILKPLKQKTQEFFALPKSAKRAIERTADNPWGYFDHELTKNTLDWKEVFDYGPAELPTDGSEPVLLPRWPRTLPGFKSAVLGYYRACESLSLSLIGAIASNLGMPEDALIAPFRPRHTSFVRLNHYPACPEPAHPIGARVPERGWLGVNHHTDAGALTVLLQADEPEDFVLAHRKKKRVAIGAGLGLAAAGAAAGLPGGGKRIAKIGGGMVRSLVR